MTNVKHIETRIVTILGIEDENGDIVKQYVLQANPQQADDPLIIRRLQEDAFNAALNAIRNARAELAVRTLS